MKTDLEAALRGGQVARRAAGRRRDDGIDVTLPGIRPRLGHRHPLTQTADELIDLFGRFGFAVARGPEVEDVHHNFDALNIPPSHPARDPLDNFYLAVGERTAGPGRAGPSAGGVAMLRSQTSTVQIRVMEAQPPPVRVIAIGRVYRPDTVDATHSFMFHQVEGLMVDRGVTMAASQVGAPAVRPELPGPGRADPLPPVVLPVHRAERRGRYALARRRPLG